MADKGKYLYERIEESKKNSPFIDESTIPVIYGQSALDDPLNSKAMLKRAWNFEKLCVAKWFSGVSAPYKLMRKTTANARKSIGDFFVEPYKKTAEKKQKLTALNRWLNDNKSYIDDNLAKARAIAKTPFKMKVSEAFYDPPTFTELSLYAYNTDEYADLIREANVALLNNEGKVLTFQIIFFPNPYEWRNKTKTVEEKAKEEVATEPEAQSSIAFVESQIEKLREYNEGLAILVFDYDDTSRFICDAGRAATQFRVKSSVHEGVAGFEMTMPFPTPDVSDEMHRSGNYVVVGYNGQVIFSGRLVSPSVREAKSRTISWVAYSHAYEIAKTHFNPQAASAQWDKKNPYQIIRTIASKYTSVPIILSDSVVDDLNKPFVDEHRMQAYNTDIMSTTPLKLIQKLLLATGVFLFPNSKGYLNAKRLPATIEDIKKSTVLSGEDGVSFESDYNYDELARSYNVSTQRRGASDSSTASVDNHPFNIFKNIVRDDAFGDLNKSAKFECYKAFCRAWHVTATVPSYLNDNNEPWRLLDTVIVDSPYITNTTARVPMFVAGIQFEGSKDWQKTTLTLWTPDPNVTESSKLGKVYMPWMPFLSDDKAPDEREIRVAQESVPNYVEPEFIVSDFEEEVFSWDKTKQTWSAKTSQWEVIQWLSGDD